MVSNKRYSVVLFEGLFDGQSIGTTYQSSNTRGRRTDMEYTSTHPGTGSPPSIHQIGPSIHRTYWTRLFFSIRLSEYGNI